MDRLSSNGQMLSQIDLSNVPHSSFDRRNHNFLSGKLGKLICTRVDEVYPGDRIKGHIETVANFEPLVAPIMGSMVLKQESFYVPDSILWKNAHKFFTAKGGFNTPVPWVSPQDIYNAYGSLGFVPAYMTFMNGVLASLPLAVGTRETNLGTWVIRTFGKTDNGFLQKWHAFGESYGVTDLILPIEEKINSYLYTPVVDDQGNDYACAMNRDLGYLRANFNYVLDTQEKRLAFVESEYFATFINNVAELFYTVFEFFFGVSSHLDYMGFPVIDNWYSFFVGDLIGSFDDHDEYLIPNMYTIIHESVFYDSSGVTIGVDPSELFSAIKFNWLPFRAAYVIWYWNYRDELLETSALDPESDTFLADSPSVFEIVLLTILRVRCWYKDTFTTALTNTGSANLSVPLQSAFTDFGFHFYTDDGNVLSNTADFDSAYQAGASYVSIETAGGLTYKVPMNYFSQSFSVSGSTLIDDVTSNYLSLDLFDRIHRLRTFLQKRLILGYEYDDMVWSSFMVKLSNVRMRIPELLSRGRDAVQLNTIVNNTTIPDGQIAGDKSAVAWASGRTSDINYFAEEHGYFLSFMTIMPVQSYTGGMQRMYMKREQFDFMWPEFATMGMDAVYNFELSAPRSKYANYGLTDEVAMQVFGYQGRYYDLKSRIDECHGRMRTDLHYMTFAREFNMRELPKLNYIFVHCWPSTDMFVVDDSMTDIIRCIDVHHALDWERRLPVPSEIL